MMRPNTFHAPDCVSVRFVPTFSTPVLFTMVVPGGRKPEFGSEIHFILGVPSEGRTETFNGIVNDAAAARNAASGEMETTICGVTIQQAD
jgi:hypothetical protein